MEQKLPGCQVSGRAQQQWTAWLTESPENSSSRPGRSRELLRATEQEERHRAVPPAYPGRLHLHVPLGSDHVVLVGRHRDPRTGTEARVSRPEGPERGESSMCSHGLPQPATALSAHAPLPPLPHGHRPAPALPALWSLTPRPELPSCPQSHSPFILLKGSTAGRTLCLASSNLADATCHVASSCKSSRPWASPGTLV